MLIANILGGLGNQMFQYSAGRSLSLIINTPLKLDTRDFLGYSLHNGLELNKLFNCDIELANNEDLENILGWQSGKYIQRILRKRHLKKLRCKNYILEPHFTYWDGFKQLSGDIYLDGYWQSERYFTEFSDYIRSDFTFKLPLSDRNCELAARISKVNAVSLHVRRGDYISNPKNAFIGTCSPAFYKRAIEYIKRQVSNPTFFVFSDDIKWAKSNLNLHETTVFTEHNKGSESYNDMRLMSICQHHIIANSSFSWWGAWLNPNPKKIVIAPQKWFASDEFDTSDLIPSSWIRF